MEITRTQTERKCSTNLSDLQVAHMFSEGCNTLYNNSKINTRKENQSQTRLVKKKMNTAMMSLNKTESQDLTQ
jgi:hypothetical protein